MSRKASKSTGSYYTVTHPDGRVGIRYRPAERPISATSAAHRERQALRAQPVQVTAASDRLTLVGDSRGQHVLVDRDWQPVEVVGHGVFGPRLRRVAAAFTTRRSQKRGA